MLTIQPPSQCPACSSELVWDNHLLYCKSSSCPAQMQKKIEHFAKTLKIKGLGPIAIAKLGLDDFYDIYSLTKDDIANALNSPKLAEKLYSEIENSKKAPLNIVLPAFSIPLIGTSASEKLSKVCKTINDITQDNCSEAGLGPKATDNLLTWLKHDFNLYYDGTLPFDYSFTSTSPRVTSGVSKGIVCISGKLTSFKTKAIATAALESAGYTVKSSLTKDVTILVNEGGIESSKTQKARESGVQIIENLTTILEI